jgi:hypothetical protein
MDPGMERVHALEKGRALFRIQVFKKAVKNAVPFPFLLIAQFASALIILGKHRTTLPQILSLYNLSVYLKRAVYLNFTSNCLPHSSNSEIVAQLRGGRGKFLQEINYV